MESHMTRCKLHGAAGSFQLVRSNQSRTLAKNTRFERPIILTSCVDRLLDCRRLLNMIEFDLANQSNHQKHGVTLLADLSSFCDAIELDRLAASGERWLLAHQLFSPSPPLSLKYVSGGFDEVSAALCHSHHTCTFHFVASRTAAKT